MHAAASADAFRHIAEAQGGVAFILEAATGRLFYISPHAAQVLGYDAGTIAAHLDGSAREPALEALCGGLAERLARLAAGDSSRRRVVREFDLRRRDGSVVPLQVVSTLVDDAGGTPAQLAGIVNDVSQARARQEERRRFASMLNHEFRTPLSTIDGAIQMLEAGAAGADEATRQRYRKIAQAVDRLVGMLDDYLTPERVEGSGTAARTTRADPLALLRDAAQYARALGRTVTVDAGAMPAALRGDPAGLRLALQVLVDNAIRYSPPEAPIALSGRVADGRLALEVADGGPGLVEDELARLFDKGFRGRHAAGTAGSGMGLYMARTVVEAHGGTISATNLPYNGAVFRIFLPIKT